LALDFRQRPACGNLEHQIGVAEQRPVTNGRNERILRPLNELETDRASAKPSTEEILDIPQQRREHGLKVVVVIDRVDSGASLGRGECCELASKSQELLV